LHCPVERLLLDTAGAACQGEEIGGVLSVAYPPKQSGQTSDHCYSESHTINIATIKTAQIWTHFFFPDLYLSYSLECFSLSLQTKKSLADRASVIVEFNNYCFYYHSITKFLFIFKSLSDSSDKSLVTIAHVSRILFVHQNTFRQYYA